MIERSTPSVVFILGDNVGWGDLGCYGGLAPPPHIDTDARATRRANRVAGGLHQALGTGPKTIFHLCLLHAGASTARPSPAFTGRSGSGTYSDALHELDHRTGQVLDAIDQAGIADNTIVVWNSDNPAGRAQSMGGSNGPWRGHFGSGFEGGMRTPAIVRWPGKVKAGVVTDEIFCAVAWSRCRGVIFLKDETMEAEYVYSQPALDGHRDPRPFIAALSGGGDGSVRSRRRSSGRGAEAESGREPEATAAIRMD